MFGRGKYRLQREAFEKFQRRVQEDYIWQVNRMENAQMRTYEMLLDKLETTRGIFFDAPSMVRQGSGSTMRRGSNSKIPNSVNFSKIDISFILLVLISI